MMQKKREEGKEKKVKTKTIVSASDTG